MNPSPVTKKALIMCLLIGTIIVIVQIAASFSDSRTTLVFCDVGQGDAAYIRIRNKIDLLVDAGPDRKVLNCLGKYMPFYDRTIELVIVSHPQKDHFGGLSYVLDRYRVNKLLTSTLDASGQSINRLKQKLEEKKIPIDFPTAGTTITILKDKLTFLWPPATQPDRLLSVRDSNELSLVFTLEENDVKVSFTGDATPRVLNSLCVGNRHACSLRVDILKIPHHGSKNGLTKNFLQLADPRVAVISVGKNNSYGHPSQEVLDMLKASKTKIRRTDVEGDIVFKLRSL